jgi:hypothetical protein
MFELIFTPLVCFGITKIIVEGSIFQDFRDWVAQKEIECSSEILKWVFTKFNQLINCYLCTGFHIGWFVGLFYGPFDAWNVIFNGAFYTACVWILYSFVQFLGNGNDPNRSIIVQFPDHLKIVKSDPLNLPSQDKKDINN